ncbi:MAG: helix-turn-helix domain-containing protein, partial [Alphaproteobacteria bacterium]
MIMSLHDKKQRKLLRNFGARLRAERLKRSLSQEELADLCGLDRTYIGGVERGERNLSLLNIFRISAALGVEASSLVP